MKAQGAKLKAEIQILLLLVFVTFFSETHAQPTQDTPDSATSYIDGNNRFLLNGKPFFPLGLYVVQSLTDASQLDEIADSPFNTLMNYNINNGTDAQTMNYLNQLESRNVKLIFSLSEYFGHGLSDIDTISRKVSTFKNHPAIISWYINDERGPEYLPELVLRYETIRQLDENHPVWSVHWNWLWVQPEAHTTDIVGVDSYPIENGPITWVAQGADAAIATGKPLWFVPQIFNWKDYPSDPRSKTGRPPTREEMRAMTYLAVNHGAKGLIYYSYFNIRDDVDYRTRWEEITGIAGEIERLTPVLLSTCQMNDNEIVCKNSNIDFKLMREGDTYYLFAVNTKKETITRVSFQNRLANGPSIIRVLFENDRQIAANKGNFTDDFDPYEVHVYQWVESLSPTPIGRSSTQKSETQR